jgi:uncharacterized lipoprotein YddW (UPF0748 family)
MNKFMEKYNLTGDLKELIRKDKIIRNQWQIFKEQELINFITNATNAMKLIKQDLIITAAVMGNKDSAKNVYLQDYEKWLKLGIIDEIEPMCYTASTKMLYERIRDLRGLISKYQVRIGISPRIDGCEIYMDLKQIMIASKYKGFVIWSSYSYEDDYIYKILKLGQLEG